MSRIDYWRNALDQVRQIETALDDYKQAAEEYEQREQKLIDWFEQNAPELIDEDQTPMEAAIELLNFYVKGPSNNG
jgi:hypothetical protein